MIAIIDAFLQLIQQGAFLSIFLTLLLLSNGTVLLLSRRKLRRLLKEKERNLSPSPGGNALLDGIPDPVVYKDARGRYAFCNAALAALWGRPREAIIGSTPRELFPDEADSLEKVDRVAKQGGRIVRSGRWLTDGRGRKGYYEIRHIPLSLGEEEPGLLILFTEMTRMKQELASLDGYREMVRRDLRERTSIYSQFLRKILGPLEQVRNRSEALLGRGERTPELREALGEIWEAGALMESYVRNLTFLAFPERLLPSSPDAEARGMSLEDWQHSLQDRCRGYSLKTGRPSYVLLCGEVPEEIRIDPAVLSGLIDRLMDNAEYYARGGLSVLIRVSRVEERYYTVNIAVRDTGPFIPAEMREEIFKPFARLDEGEGSRRAGLGLAVARRLAERLGGSLSCDPSCEDGARFLLSLPPMRGSGTVISGHRLEGSCPGWPSPVLVADDEELFRRRLAGQLREAGLAVVEAADGREALAAVEVQDPQLLLIDEKMPFLRGREVLEQIGRKPGREAYLMGSGYNLEAEALSAEGEPSCETLVKPLDWSLLLDILIRERTREGLQN